ncbi:MAG: T9SS type A sorting domain-containing protein [Bacteroidales bacterium]|nr:T9SS type A sorting domain-containing protein [Bacteroidales bacterium]
MKKTLLLTLGLIFSMIVMGQNTINLIDEDFSDSGYPEGWTKAGVGTNNWYVSPSFGAGGKPNEMQLSWSPQFNGTARFVSPAIDLAGVNSAMLSLDIYVVMFSGKAKIGVATSSDDGATWNDVWTEEYTATEKVSILKNISGPDMGKHNVKFCFYFEGNSYAISGIYFDNFKVYIVESIGIEATSIDVPKYIVQGEQPINFSVKNIGETTIKSFEARCIINGEETFTESFYTELNYLDTKQFTFEDMYDFNFGEDYEIEIEIFRVNDEELETVNKITKEIGVAMYGTQRTPMIEHFSSSTCAPCVAVNNTMAELTHNNEGKYTYTKYTANGPGMGDPYYTQEVGTKMSYYNVIGVPQLHFDGALIDKATVNDAFQSHYNNPALANVRGAFNVEGTTINVTADFMTYFNTKNIKAYVSVNEKTTTGNTRPISSGGNGETEFHHVMLKMLSGDEGKNIELKAGEYKRLEFSYNMEYSFMEDINDLEVALWIQDGETKDIYNSHFAYEYTSQCYPVENVITSISNNNLKVKWNAPETGNPVGYNVYLDGVLASEKVSALEYTSEFKNNVYVEVVAVYENEKTSIGIVKEITAEENISDIMTDNISIYPNPVNDRLYIETSTQTQSIEIYDIYGRVQNLRNSETQKLRNSIDVSDLNSGIYFVKVKTEEGNIVKRIIKN